MQPLVDECSRVPEGTDAKLNSVEDRCELPGRGRDGANPRIPEGGTDANSI